MESKKHEKRNSLEFSFRVKLAVHKESKECVAVKIMHLDGDNALTLDCLKKEVGYYLIIHLI